jgi:hypothetical protein
MAMERYRIVVANLTLFLDAQDLIQIDAGDRDERRTFMFRLHREPGVVLAQVYIADEHVGRFAEPGVGGPV